MSIAKIKPFLTVELSDEEILLKAGEIAKNLEITDLEAIDDPTAKIIATRINQSAQSVIQPVTPASEEIPAPEERKAGKKTKKNELVKQEPAGAINTPPATTPKQAYQEPSINVNDAVAQLAGKAVSDVDSFRNPISDRIEQWSDQVSQDMYAEVGNAGKVAIAKFCKKAIAEGSDQDLEQFRGLGESVAASIFPLR